MRGSVIAGPDRLTLVSVAVFQLSVKHSAVKTGGRGDGEHTWFDTLKTRRHLILARSLLLRPFPVEAMRTEETKRLLLFVCSGFSTLMGTSQFKPAGRGRRPEGCGSGFY